MGWGEHMQVTKMVLEPFLAGQGGWDIMLWSGEVGSRAEDWECVPQAQARLQIRDQCPASVSSHLQAVFWALPGLLARAHGGFPTPTHL